MEVASEPALRVPVDGQFRDALDQQSLEVIALSGDPGLINNHLVLTKSAGFT